MQDSEPRTQDSEPHAEKQLVDLSSLFHDDETNHISIPSQPMSSALPPQRGSGRMWLIIGIAAAVVLVLLLVLVPTLLNSSNNSGGGQSSYTTQAVVQGNFFVPVTATGPVQGTTYGQDFGTSGRVASINVSVGNTVTAGQTLATLDANSLPVGANPSEATLTAIHAGTVTAINGTAGSSSTALGNSNSSSSSSSTSNSSSSTSTGTHFIQIVDQSSLFITANVNEADYPKIAASPSNAPVTFTIASTAFGQTPFTGTVSAAPPLPQSASNVVTYPVTISVNMNNLQGATLTNGLTANVIIDTEQRTNVLMIPTSAVSFASTAASQGLISSAAGTTAQTQAEQQLSDFNGSNVSGSKDNAHAAFVLVPSNGQLVAKPVVIGLSDGTNYEVLAGLTNGQTIATSSPSSNSPAGQQSTPSGSGGGPGGRGGNPLGG